MSTSANPPAQQNNRTGSTTPSSAWSRGPPTAANSKPSSAIQTPTSSSGTPQPQAEGTKTETNGSKVLPVAIGGHARQGSLIAGTGMYCTLPFKHALIITGAIQFGTMDSDPIPFSSSPAAPPNTGTHLAGTTVQSFGSIDADASTDPNAVKAPRRAVNGPANGGKPLDAHALFGAKPKPSGPPAGAIPAGQPTHDRRQSTSSFQGPNGAPPHPAHLRPPQQPGAGPGQPRSPIMSQPGQSGFNPGAPQMQQGFRPPQHMAGTPGFVRPNGPPPQMQPGMQRNMGMGAFGMHPGPYPVMGYPQQGYYVSGNRIARLVRY
jgi:hypothetical protein